MFPLPSCVLPSLACRANNFARGVYIFKISRLRASKLCIICSYIKCLNIFSNSHSEAIESNFAKIAHKVAKSNIFEKFKLDRNLQRILFKMMYNMSMLRHRFSNGRWGGGGGGGAEPPSSLIL